MNDKRKGNLFGAAAINQKAPRVSAKSQNPRGRKAKDSNGVLVQKTMKRATNLQRRAVVRFVLSRHVFVLVNGGNHSFNSVRVCSVGVEH